MGVRSWASARASDCSSCAGVPAATENASTWRASIRALRLMSSGMTVPLDPRFNAQRSVGHGGGRGRERQLLGRVVTRVGAEERYQVAKTLDESGLRIHGDSGKVHPARQLRNWGP